MFERLQKPFLTVETGEAYQPIRLAYDILQPTPLAQALDSLKCLEKKADTWTWNWSHECDDLHFESLESFQKNAQKPLRLGTLSIRDNQLHLNLPSFKRACLAVPFFFRHLNAAIAKPAKADFINKVFGLSERLPHGFTELFNESELDQFVHQRVSDYEKVQERVEMAGTADEAISILSEYTKAEAQKRLPYAERYVFQEALVEGVEPDVIFLGFYIFLRGRELVAIRRWFGESGFTLEDAADKIITQVFGNMDIDVIE